MEAILDMWPRLSIYSFKSLDVVHELELAIKSDLYRFL